MNKLLSFIGILLLCFCVTAAQKVNGVNLFAKIDGVSGPARVDGVYQYLLNDTFTTPLTAGNVNGTAAEPGPGTRTVTDTNNAISISGGLANLARGDSSWVDCFLHYGQFTRVPGRLGLFKMVFTDIGATFSSIVGWVKTLDGGNPESSFSTNLTAGTQLNFRSGAANVPVATIVAATSYKFAIALRSAGAFCFIKGGVFTNWTLLYGNPNGNFATPYFAVIDNKQQSTYGSARVPTLRWLPIPLLSTSGAMTWPTTNGLGHAEGVAGGLGAGGGNLILLDGGTWSVAGGYVVNTPAQNETVSDPAFGSPASWSIGTGWDVGVTTPGLATKTAGTASALINTSGITSINHAWYHITADLVVSAGSITFCPGSQNQGYVNTTQSYLKISREVGGTGKPFAYATADFAGTVDNFHCKYLPISQLITNCQLATTDILVEQVIHAFTSGTQVGMSQSDRSFAAKCAATAAAGQAVIALKEIGDQSATGLTTNDTITIAGTTYTIASITGGSNVAYNDTTKTQTVTLGSNLGAQVNVDDKVGLDWASWNGVLCYFDGYGNIKLDEVKAGVYTNRISAAVAFVADKRLIVRKIGTEYRVFFNETLIGSTTAVDAAAMAGKYVGAFSTLAANQITSMAVYDTGNVTNCNSILDLFSN